MMNSLRYFAQDCLPGSGVDFSIPTWYRGLPCDANGVPTVDNLNEIWIVGLNIVEILIFTGGVAAVFFLIYGGIQYVTSQGQPDKLSFARRTLIYSIVGLVVVILSRVIVQFIVNALALNSALPQP